jgi:hypothetical protein
MMKWFARNAQQLICSKTFFEGGKKMRHSESKFQSRVMKVSYLAVCCLLLSGWDNKCKKPNGNDQSCKVFIQRRYSNRSTESIAGVRLDMTMEEARAKLGTATFKSDELDFYVLSANEAAQIAYNAAHKVDNHLS